MSQGISASRTTVAPERRPLPTRPEALSVRTSRQPTKETAAAVPEAEAVATSRPGRKHVQRNLHHLNREVRHAIKDALKEVDGMDRETVKAYQELARDFRDSLHATFQAAGEGEAFDHAAILSGVSEAMTGLTESLQAMRGAVDGAEPVETPVDGVELVDDRELMDDMLPGDGETEPLVGGLVATYA